MVDNEQQRGAGATLELALGDQVEARDPLAPGQVIGHFVIRARLGEGGMGVVLACHDTDLDRKVAIKVLKPGADQPAYAARLLREAQAMARLEHRNVLRVYEVGTDRDRLFVAMELVDGITLTEWLRQQRRSVREILAMFHQVGAGLAAVHRGGLVHRDFKPDNVLVDRAGVARVADFGLARFEIDPMASTASPAIGATLTHTGVVMGTPGFMAPEQQFGADVDARADQYSFCVALREALFAKRGASANDRELPRQLRSIVTRGLAYDREDRYASMDELLAEFERVTRQRRARGAPMVLAAIVIAGGASAVIATVRGNEDGQPPGPRVQPAVVGQSSPASTAPAASPPVVVTASTAVSPPGDRATDRDHSATIPPNAGGTHNSVAAQDPARTNASSNHSGSKPVAPAPIKPPDRAGSGAAKKDPFSGGGLGSYKAPPASPHPTPPPAPPPSVKPVRHEVLAARRAAVRAAIAELGYDGLELTGDDREADIRELRTTLAGETAPLERGTLLYAIGAVERKRGNCAAAERPWNDAQAELEKAWEVLQPRAGSEVRDRMVLFSGRIMFGRALCALDAGHAVAALDLVLKVYNSTSTTELERASHMFAKAIANIESGDTDLGQATLYDAWQSSPGTLRKTIEQYGHTLDTP
jgi:serine/threonine protein kinase